MDPKRGIQKNAEALGRLQEYERQRQINEYRQKYRSPALRMAPDYTQGFNYTPEDLLMAKLMGITLPAQAPLDYKMKSFTESDVKSLLGR